MEDMTWVRKVTAAAGLIVGLSVFASVPLYFMYGGPPPAWNVLTRDLIALITCGGLLVFVAGVGHLTARAGDAAVFASKVATGAGYVIALINLAFVPSLYFGTDPTDFYAVHSWANSAVTGSLLCYWMIGASIVLLRSRRVEATT